MSAVYLCIKNSYCSNDLAVYKKQWHFIKSLCFIMQMLLMLFFLHCIIRIVKISLLSCILISLRGNGCNAKVMFSENEVSTIQTVLKTANRPVSQYKKWHIISSASLGSGCPLSTQVTGQKSAAVNVHFCMLHRTLKCNLSWSLHSFTK